MVHCRDLLLHGDLNTCPLAGLNKVIPAPCPPLHMFAVVPSYDSEAVTLGMTAVTFLSRGGISAVFPTRLSLDKHQETNNDKKRSERVWDDDKKE